MRTVEFTLRRYLDAHGLSAYRLAEAARGRLSRGTVYALARGQVARLDLGTLGAVMTALEELTGQEVHPADLLSAVTVTVPQVPDEKKPDAEARAWLGGDVSHLSDFEPYDWGETDPASVGQSVSVGPDGQLVLGE